jgi:hypothetical protein
VRRAEEALVRVRDLAGRARGTAFHVDHQGTLLTSHEVVDGATGLLLTWPGGATRRLAADAVTGLPEYGLALLHTDALLPPLALAGGGGTRLVHLRVDDHALQGGVAGLVTARYAAADRFHLVADVWLLELDQAPYGLPVQAAGTPVLDAETGAAVAVATVALRSRRRGAVLAVPLRAAAGQQAVADLLARNSATVPAHGRALNLAGVLDLAAATLPTTLASTAPGPDPDLYPASDRPPADCPDPDRPVLALVGEPGSGRTAELAALARQRSRSAHRMPTVWLRGAELQAGDGSLLDAVDRVLRRSEQYLRGTTSGVKAERACRIAAGAHRPLLVVLDAPEEMPGDLHDRWDEWTTATGRALRRVGAQLVIGCRAEFWEQAGPLFPVEDLVGTGSPPQLRPAEPSAAGQRPLLRQLLAEIRAAAPALPASPAPTRAQLFGARVDLACLRIAEQLTGAPAPAGAVRRRAAAAAGRLHEAARRMLGPGGGALGRADFDEIFPWETGWAQAVLAEGLLGPAGPGYRFAHEELGEWLQGGHLDLATALDALLGDGLPTGPAAEPAPGRIHPAVRGAHRRGGPRGHPVPAPEPPPAVPAPRPVPHHRIGPVREALLRLAGADGDPESTDPDAADPGALEPWLSRLVLRLDGPDAATPGTDAHWWTRTLLTSVLLGLPDAAPHLPLLRTLAERMAHRAAETGGQPLPLSFWADLPLPVADRIDLLKLPARSGEPAAPDAIGRLVRGDPVASLRALCRWFRDERVADAAVHLLRAHRRFALDDLTEALVDAAHPRADALLRELAGTEPSAMCRATDRWAHDPRPERHVAAAVHGPSVRAESEPDRSLLRFAAETLLTRDGEPNLHGAALALLVADPLTRGRHLPAAVAHYAAGEQLLTARQLLPALDTHTALVLSGYAVRMRRPGEEAAAILDTLGTAAAPRAQAAVVRLVADHLGRRPEAAAQVAAWLAARTRQTPSERATLLPFVRDLAAGHPDPVLAAFRSALADDPTPLGRELAAVLGAAPHSDEPMQASDQAHGRL